jgi:hypothetical protein
MPKQIMMGIKRGMQTVVQNNHITAIGNGYGLIITHIGSSLSKQSHSQFSLKNILHCPDAASIFFPIKDFAKIIISGLN